MRAPAATVAAVLSAFAALAWPSDAVGAQDAGVVRGRVFDCATGAPVAGASVRIETSSVANTVVTGLDGRFIRVGQAPGALTVSAVAPAGWAGHVESAHRVGTLEPGDVLDVGLGLRRELRVVDAGCQSRIIPPATSVATRYIIH